MFAAAQSRKMAGGSATQINEGKGVRAYGPNAPAKRNRRISANREIFQLGTLFELGRQPPRLATTAAPCLRTIVGIDILNGGWPTLARGRGTAAEQVAQRKTGILSDGLDLLLYFRALAFTRVGNRLIELCLEIDQLL